MTLLLSAEERDTLEHWQRSTTIAAGLARRGKISSSWPRDTASRTWRARGASNGRWCVSGPSACSLSVWKGSPTPLAAGPRAGFPPEVAIHGVRWACERPDPLGRSLSQGDGHRTGAAAHRDGDRGGHRCRYRASDSGRQLRPPWRQHVWLYPKQPRDAAFSATLAERIGLSTRPLREDELVLSVDEQTSLQLRPRRSPPCQPSRSTSHPVRARV